MTIAGQPTEIFDRRRRRALRKRATQRDGDRFLWDYIADELTERLELVSRSFGDALILGPMAGYAPAILAARRCDVVVADIVAATGQAVVTEEDFLPFDPQRFDLVISAGTLDSVNDLPGALIQIRRILKPDGLFLGHMFGAGSLATLKSLMMIADAGGSVPHIHPQIDLRSAADLLARAGFALPVADSNLMPVRYRDWRALVVDLRNAGIGNALAGPRHFMGKSTFDRMDAEWQRRADHDSKVEERFNHLFLSGWAPAPDQQKPAARGSGAVSLASVLRSPKPG